MISPAHPRRRSAPLSLDFGRWLARLLCAVFALLGAVPLAGGLVVRAPPVRAWAARETARVLRELLGVEARYQVEASFWPLELALTEVAVASTDGRGPAFRAERMAVTPRIFSLLAGRLDVGDIAIDRPVARIVLRGGRLANVHYSLPKSSGGPRPKLRRAPFASLAVTDAALHLDVDGAQVETGPLDLDVFAADGPSFEVALRLAESHITSQRQVQKPAPGVAHDEDVVCQVDLRLRFEPGLALLRRLEVSGGLDDDARPSTAPTCAGLDSHPADPRRVSVELSQLRVLLADGKPSRLSGHVSTRVPLTVLGRLGAGAFRGWTAFTGEVSYDPARPLPEVQGRVSGAGVALGPYMFSEELEGDLGLSEGVIRSAHLTARYGHGTAMVEDLRVAPLAKGVPLSIRSVHGTGVHWEDLMENIDVTRNTILQWNLDELWIRDFKGTLVPLALDSRLEGTTTGFEIFDRAYHAPARRHMIGVKKAHLAGRFAVRPDSVHFLDTDAVFGSSKLHASVKVGFHNELWLDVREGSELDLADVSPLIDIPMSGKATVRAHMAGLATHAELKAALKIDDLVFAGFPLGDIETADVSFVPLKVTVRSLRGKNGQSTFLVPSARLAFDEGASLLVDALVRSEPLELRDFFAMWHFDSDPRFDSISGRGRADARVHYALGGPEDRCKTGALRVDGRLALSALEMYEERYDSAAASFDFRWKDRDASYLGVDLDVPDLSLTKGSGTLLGDLTLREGAVQGQIIGTEVPLSKVQSLGTLERRVDGKISVVAELGGTLDALSAEIQSRIGAIRVGRHVLPPSHLTTRLEPIAQELHSLGTTACGRPRPAPFQPEDLAADRPQGVFHTEAKLFGGQVELHDLRITRQAAKVLSGKLDIDRLDLGALAELSPELAVSETPVEGRLSASVTLERLETARPSLASATVEVRSVAASRGDLQLRVPEPASLGLRDGTLSIPALSLALATPDGQLGSFGLRGRVSDLPRGGNADLTLTLRPTELSKFSAWLPRAERLGGTLQGRLTLRGPWSHLRHEGRFELGGGELVLQGSPVALRGVELAVDVTPNEVRISRGSASVGDGRLTLSGGAPLSHFDVGTARVHLAAREVSLPLGDGVQATADADLDATWSPEAEGSQSKAALPRISGDVTLQSFAYTRPITMSADLTSSLAKRGQLTQVETYDPAEDRVELDVTVRSRRPLQVRNNLVDARIVVEPQGLLLTGTNQRFGLRGQLDVVQGGSIRMRRNEFEITGGYIRFDDPTRIAPKVDVSAVTDYRRYHDSSSTGAAGAAAGATGGATAASTAGRWRIRMRAHGDADHLRIDLSSEPDLSQDDIFLLLTLGLTRAELDRAQSASLGQSMALEALGRLTGADEAVTRTVPVIDEFRVGSAYSTRTGRTEPTITVGKRLANRIRAYVTSGITESREIRSNVEWRLNPKLSVEGSYDNLNDISTSSLGNLGADVRWRLEFE